MLKGQWWQLERDILMIHPHDLFDRSEPWIIRMKSIAREFVKKDHKVRLCYFPLTINEKHYPKNSDSIELIPLDRTPSPNVFILNIIKPAYLCNWANIIHFQKCHYYAALPALIAAWVKNKPIHYDCDDWETKIFYYSNPKQFVVGEFINIFEKLIPKIVNSISVLSKHLHKLCLIGKGSGFQS